MRYIIAKLRKRLSQSKRRHLASPILKRSPLARKPQRRLALKHQRATANALADAAAVEVAAAEVVVANKQSPKPLLPPPPKASSPM
jgi:hypothetical protein